MKIRTKKRIAAAVGAICLLAVLGVVGGMDAGSIQFGAGAAWAFGLEAVGTAALWKSGVIRWLW